MTNGPVSNINTNDALTKADYLKLREAHDNKVRSELERESEKDRQKRLWAEQNAARNA
jgi:hypothetical protein